MAAVVASTLRRRTQKHADSIRYQVVEGQSSTGSGGAEPTALGPPTPTRTSSFRKSQHTRSPQHLPLGGQGSLGGTPQNSYGLAPQQGTGILLPGIRLYYENFWPRCENTAEQDLSLNTFEPFEVFLPLISFGLFPGFPLIKSKNALKTKHIAKNLSTKSLKVEFYKSELEGTLLTRANAWLQDNIEVEVIKCETVERKISDVSQLISESAMFVPHGNTALYIKGLRSALQNVIPSTIGYMNVVPKCLNSIGRVYPMYEDLPETYGSVNEYMDLKPLDGKILTIETVGLKLPCNTWTGPEVNPDLTYMSDELQHHLLYITRIFFIFGYIQSELIGAQDFLPDFEQTSTLNPSCYPLPKYKPLSSALKKTEEWLGNARNIQVVNIQTLDAAYKHQPEDVHTGVTFIERIDSNPVVRFIRVTYTRKMKPKTASTSSADVSNSSNISPPTSCPPPNGSTEPTGGMDRPRGSTVSSTSGLGHRPPSQKSKSPGFSYRTFIPAAVKIGMCSGSPEYEWLTYMWHRSRAWLHHCERRLISVETISHPLNHLWHEQDGGETTAVYTDWRRSILRRQQRQPLVQIIRVYLDGMYSEPPAELLPALPNVEEFNDCRCNIM